MCRVRAKKRKFYVKRGANVVQTLCKKIYAYKVVEDTKKEKPSQLLPGWGAGIRTPIGRSRDGSPTIERHPNISRSFVRDAYDTVSSRECQAAICPYLTCRETLAVSLCIGSPCPSFPKGPMATYHDMCKICTIDRELDISSTYSNPLLPVLFYCHTRRSFHCGTTYRHIPFCCHCIFPIMSSEGMTVVFASTRGPLVSTML